MHTSNRLSFFDKFLTLDIARILGHPNHVAGRMVRGVLVFDGDPLSAITHIERFNAHASGEKVFHQDVLMLLFMGSLGGHNSWLHDHGPKSISSIEEFVDGFLSHFQVYPEEALIEHHQDIEDISNEQEDKSLSCPHDENDDFEDTCWEG